MGDSKRLVISFVTFNEILCITHKAIISLQFRLLQFSSTVKVRDIA
jgi:hypothetical protein